MIGLSEMASSSLPKELLDHFDAAEAAATANLERVTSNPEIDRKLKSVRLQLASVPTAAVPPKNRIIRLRHLASEFTSPFAQQTACARGCSHCCNIGVAVPRSEAKLIAKSIGRQVMEPAETTPITGSRENSRFFGTPCTFLVEGSCSIYAHRPLVCRTLVNMDDTDLLCRLIDGANVPVPYLNTTKIQGLFGFLTKHDDFADIREWFPNR